MSTEIIHHVVSRLRPARIAVEFQNKGGRFLRLIGINMIIVPGRMGMPR